MSFFLSKPVHSGGAKEINHQTNLVTTMGKNNPNTENEFDLAIAHFIAANSLHFSLVEDLRFKKILILSRSVNNSYLPPSRTTIVRTHLPALYSSYRAAAIKKLIGEAPLSGFTLLGDGASIRKISLVNIIASNPGKESCMLDVVDCSEHIIAEDGRKDAWYIAKMFLTVLRERDPNKQYCDMVVFDGASNCYQKGARLIEEHYPWVTDVCRGIEHTVFYF